MRLSLGTLSSGPALITTSWCCANYVIWHFAWSGKKEKQSICMLKNMEKMTENFCLTVLVLQQCFQKHFQTFSCVSPYGQDKLLDLVSEIWIENPKSRIQEQSVLLNHFWHYILRFCCRFSSVQSLSHVRLFATPWIAARQASLSITSSRSFL